MTPKSPESPPPLDVPTQRHRRHLGTYLRKFGAVIRKKVSDSDLASTSHVEKNDGPSTTTNPVRSSIDNASRHSKHAPSVDSMDRSSVASGRRSSVRSDPRSLDSRGSIMTGMSTVSNVDRSAARQERAQFLFAKYGLAMSSDFPPERNQALRSTTEPLQRIQKRTRLRMHASCHECKTPFGAGSFCVKCKHRRCRLCPRAAPKGVQQLVEHTKRQLESLMEPPGGLDIKKLHVKETQYDYSQRSPTISVDSGRSTPSPITKPRSRYDSRVEPDLPDSPRTMESVLAARDPVLPRPLSLHMNIDAGAFEYRSPHNRDLCYSLEMATAKLCERQGLDLQKLQRLFPLSFKVVQALTNKSRQQRVFRLPRFKVRVPCPGCGQPLPGRAGSCQICMNVGFGGRHALRRPLAVC
ncbi:hypothetical protein BDZ85DRAFT_57467 [Elsinoe ampelina]|uniref:Uncharacterized protein n=1 Tax=Elsinoe ampelina TaxID=302913 RepID=A0A6A6GNH7_9PEZI|nr:hypothetical protein BDZ85DRAFT_57467 [Elsinoe ampelina]